MWGHCARYDTAELRRAIAEPAARAGRPFDRATVDLLLTETEGHEGALPLLQFALTRVWEGLADGVAPADTLRDLGGVGGALAGEAQRLYDSLSASDQAIARRAFLGLVRLGEGTRDTRRRIAVADLVAYGEDADHVRQVLRLFSRPSARLITFAADVDGTDTAEITHEALFEHWEALQTWLAHSRADLRLHRRVDEATKHWEEQGHPVGSLWSSPDLDLLRAFHQRAGSDMTATQMAFFRASVRKEQRAKWLRRAVGATLIALTLAAGGIAYIARQAQMAATMERNRAEQEREKAQRRFDDVRTLANAFMFDFHDAIANLAGSTPARMLVVRKALEYLDRLAPEAIDDIALQRALGVSYSKVGEILTRTGDTAGALEQYRKSLAILEGLATADPTNAQAQRDLSVSYHKIGDTLGATGDTAGALEQYRKSLTIREGLATADPTNAQAQRDLSISYEKIGDTLGATGDTAGALEQYRKSPALSTWASLGD